ncbi:MAG: T9SS type A sorting domain-containing protein [Candidatus Marinimicrobia bacterium]|nr:T9SS type A sorting domain-containing protein [Candidatus Neomarinimicrobiota bacterium]
MSKNNQTHFCTVFLEDSIGTLCRKVLFVLSIILLNMTVIFSQTTFTVTSTGDEPDSQLSDGICNNGFGDCTFRAAIEQANYTGGVDTILFNIPGVGPHTIQPNYAYPNVTESIIIDGTTEPDFAGSPVIELDGSNTSVVDGLTIIAGNSVVRGLVVNRFEPGDDEVVSGIMLRQNGGNVIEGCYVGTDPTGTIALGNGIGVYLGESQNNIIGGTTVASRNIISGNAWTGIDISASTGANLNNQIIGNFIGTDVTGTLALGNGVGIFLFTSGNIIGGVEPGAGNLISGNSDGIVIAGEDPPASNNIVQGNLIGTDVNGNSAIPNETGIYIDASDNVIGGTEIGTGNLISGNNTDGLLIAGEGPSASNNIVQGNLIGTDITGTAALGNGYSGITVTSTNNLIGGVTASARNVISGNNYIGIKIQGSWNEFGTADSNIVQGNYIGPDITGTALLPNGLRGLWIWDGSDNLIGGLTPNAGNTIAGHEYSATWVIEDNSQNNSILSNTMYDNGNGIDLTESDIWYQIQNDSLDIDEGANRYQNYPDILQASIDEFGDISVQYHVDSHNAYADYPLTVQFFKADNVNRCQGETLLFTDIFTIYDYYFGYKIIDLPNSDDSDLSFGDFITATATDSSGNTSEFNPGVMVSAAFDFSLSDTYFSPGVDSVFITSRMSSSTGLNLMAIIQAPDSVQVDSVSLYDDGAHNDDLSGDSLFGNVWSNIPADEQDYFIDLQIATATNDTTYYDNIDRFTTTGPLVFDGLYYNSDTTLVPGEYTYFRFNVLNNGSSATIAAVTAELTSPDSCVAEIKEVTNPRWGHIAPGESKRMDGGRYKLTISESCPGNTDVIVKLRFASDGVYFWEDEVTFRVNESLSVDNEVGIIPEQFCLHQNYPNPFNPITTIRYDLSEQSLVTITIYDLLGRQVRTLVNGVEEPGYKSLVWGATNNLGQPVSAGMYLYQIKVYDPDAIGAGDYTQTRKLVLLK